MAPKNEMAEINKTLKLILKELVKINSKKDIQELPEEELYKKAKSIAIKYGKISASILQRSLKIGYARSAHILDMLEDNKVINHRK